MVKKKREKIDLPENIKNRCMAIIHGASVACGATGTGLAQIPLADNAVITPIQIGMIVALGKVFDLSITQSAARAIISGAGASLIGRGISQVLWGWIPVVGNAINTATAAGLTEAIGWMAVDQFAREAGNASNAKEEAYTTAFDDEVSPEPPTSESENNDKAAPTLEDRMNEFIQGQKNRTDHEDEYSAILEEVEARLDQGNDSLKPLYEQFLYVI